MSHVDATLPVLVGSPTLARYTRAIVQILAAGIAILVVALTDDVVTTTELVNVAIAIVGAVVVWLVPTLPDGWRHYAKPATAFVAAALAALNTLLSDGVTTAEWLSVMLAALGAIGVAVLPNAGDDDLEPAPIAGDVYVISNVGTANVPGVTADVPGVTRTAQSGTSGSGGVTWREPQDPPPAF